MNIRLATYYHAKDVPALPGSNIFHSTELFHVLEQTRGVRPLLLVAYEGKSPVGKLLCITRRSTNLLRFAEKSYAYGTGEYFPSSYPKEHIFQELLSYFTQQFAEKSFLLEFRNLEEPLFGYRYFRQNGYFPIRWLRVRNSLHHDSLDKWMSTSRKRQIHQGLKNGAVIDVARTEADVQAFFSMLKHYYSPKIHRYLPDIGFFTTLLASHCGRIFIIRYKNKIIGGSVCLFSGEDAYLLFSGGMRKTYPLQFPGVLAVWGAMQYAREHGYAHFEFIDAGLPFKKYGFRDFILRFGGKQMSSRRWFHVRWNWLNRLLTKVYEWIKLFLNNGISLKKSSKSFFFQHNFLFFVCVYIKHVL